MAKIQDKLLKGIPALYEQEEQKNPKVYLKITLGLTTMLVIEYSNDIFFGFTCLNQDWEMAELGYFPKSELENFSIKVEKINKTLEEAKEELYNEIMNS